MIKPKKLIQPTFKNKSIPQLWADLGCGKGAFTYALAELLPEESKIFAIDNTHQKMRGSQSGVAIEFIKADFNKDTLPLKNLDGILMANSLHFVHDKMQCLRKQERYFTGAGKFIVIEYDTNHSNPWVPYPITFSKLKVLFNELNYSEIELLGKQKSKFGGSVYAAMSGYKT